MFLKNYINTITFVKLSVNVGGEAFLWKVEQKYKGSTTKIGKTKVKSNRDMIQASSTGSY